MGEPADLPSAAGGPTAVTAVPPIRLGQFLKVAGLAATGGEAKSLISEGEVLVNGEVETRRGRRLEDGDVIAIAGAGAVILVPAAQDDTTLPTDGAEGRPDERDNV